MYPDVPNIPVPIKFVFVLLNTRDHYLNETKGIGRAMGALFSDEVFIADFFKINQKIQLSYKTVCNNQICK